MAFIAITPRSTLAGVVAPERVLFMDNMELLGIYTLWKQMTNAKLNCLKENCLVI